MNHEEIERIRWRRVLWGVTGGSALTSLGFSLAALSSEGRADRYILYNLSRSVAIVAAVGVAGVGLRRSATGVTEVGVLMTVVQAMDAGVGLVIRDPLKTYGPAGLAVVSVLALIALQRAERAGGRHAPGAPPVTGA